VQAAAAARKAELHYERRVAAVEREGEEKMMLMCRAAAGVGDEKVEAAATVSHEECVRLLRLRGEELRIVRKQVEVLEQEVQQAAAAASVPAAAAAEIVTLMDAPPASRQHASAPASSSAAAAAMARAAAAPAKARSVFERLADESNFTGATREKILMKRVRIKFIGRWMARWRQALPALRAERVAALAASKVGGGAQFLPLSNIVTLWCRPASRRRPSARPRPA
jgi:hypothetical protein